MTEGKFTELLGYPDSVVEFGDEWHHKGMVYRSIVLTYLGESDMYKGKVTELRSDAITKFEKVGETMTVEEAIAFTKDLSDDKN